MEFEPHSSFQISQQRAIYWYKVLCTRPTYDVILSIFRKQQKSTHLIKSPRYQPLKTVLIMLLISSIIMLVLMSLDGTREDRSTTKAIKRILMVLKGLNLEKLLIIFCTCIQKNGLSLLNYWSIIHSWYVNF